MEIARLTAICRKTDCGPLENEIVRLRAQLATLEERKTGDSESEAEEEMEFASQADADGELARANADLEERLEIEIDSCFDLQSKNADLKTEILEIKSELACRECEMCVGHRQDYKDMCDLYKEGLQEDMQQYGRVLEVEEENQKLKDQMAMMATGDPAAGFGGDLRAEEQAY